MARGAPDGVLKTLVTFAAGQAAEEYAAGAAGNYNGALQTYQTVASWTVTTDRTGELKEIIILSDNYAKTEVEIVIDSVTWCTDWSPQASMPLIFEDLRLASAAVVTVKAQSTDGTTIDVDAIITGKEIG